MQKIAEPNALQYEFRNRFPELVLASSSPNRKALLEIAGIKVRVFKPMVSEEKIGVSNEEKILNIAKTKLSSYLKSSSFIPSLPAIAADTLVLFEGRLIGKPEDRAEADAILHKLSGKSHHVLTAVGLFIPNGETSVFLDKSSVVFRNLSDMEIDAYLDTSEWQGAAGGYRLQKTGYSLVDRIDGDWSNVVGLPLRAILNKMIIS